MMRCRSKQPDTKCRAAVWMWDWEDYLSEFSVLTDSPLATLSEAVPAISRRLDPRGASACARAKRTEDNEVIKMTRRRAFDRLRCRSLREEQETRVATPHTVHGALCTCTEKHRDLKALCTECTEDSVHCDALCTEHHHKGWWEMHFFEFPLSIRK